LSPRARCRLTAMRSSSGVGNGARGRWRSIATAPAFSSTRGGR
jgi:hypothetical protein